jgi:hypothetical protein
VEDIAYKEAEILRGLLAEVGYGDTRIDVVICPCGFCNELVPYIYGYHNVPEDMAIKALFLAAEAVGKPHPCVPCRKTRNNEIAYRCEQGDCSSK